MGGRWKCAYDEGQCCSLVANCCFKSLWILKPFHQLHSGAVLTDIASKQINKYMWCVCAVYVLSL